MEKFKISLGGNRIDKLGRKMNYSNFYNRINYMVDCMVQDIVRTSNMPLGSAAIESARYQLKKLLLNTSYGLLSDPSEPSALYRRYGRMSRTIDIISTPYQIMNRRYHKSWIWLNQFISSINNNSPEYIKCAVHCLKPSTSLDINAVIWSNEYVKSENADDVYFSDFEAVSSFYPKIDLSTLKLNAIRMFPWLPAIPINLTKNPFDAMYRPEKSRQFIDTLYLKK